MFLALLLAICLPSYAGDRRLPETPSAASFHQLAQQVGLSADQERAIQDLVYKANLAKIDIKARRDRAELTLRQLLNQTSFDDKAVHTALEDLNSAEADLRRNRVELVLAIRKLCNAEQWTSLQALWLAKEDPPPPPEPPDGPNAPPPPR